MSKHKLSRRAFVVANGATVPMVLVGVKYPVLAEVQPAPASPAEQLGLPLDVVLELRCGDMPVAEFPATATASIDAAAGVVVVVSGVVPYACEYTSLRMLSAGRFPICWEAVAGAALAGETMTVTIVF